MSKFVTEKVKQLDSLPKLLMHGDQTATVVLSPYDINKIKLCSRDLHDKISVRSPEPQWYSFEAERDGETVLCMRLVKVLIRVPFSDVVDTNNITIDEYELGDYHDMVDESLDETDASKMLDEIIDLLR